MSDTPRTDAAAQEWDGNVNNLWREFADLERELSRENAALKQRIIDDNKAYGCELRDPSGTIWDHAKRLQEENAALRADKERLDWLGSQKGQPWLCWDIPLRLTREVIDALRKEAQP